MNSVISETFIDKLGILQKLPIYRVCLKNNNATFLENKPSDNISNEIGAIGIKQKKTGLDCTLK